MPARFLLQDPRDLVLRARPLSRRERLTDSLLCALIFLSEVLNPLGPDEPDEPGLGIGVPPSSLVD